MPVEVGNALYRYLSVWFFPSRFPGKPVHKRTLAHRFNRAWNRTAWTRNPQKLYRVTLGGRTGKLFLNWVTEDVVLGMFANWQKFSAWALDYKPEYLHGGHLIDRVGYKAFVKQIFEGVEFNPEAKMADDIYWAENEQRGNMHVMPLSQHKQAGPGSASAH